MKRFSAAGVVALALAAGGLTACGDDANTDAGNASGGGDGKAKAAKVAYVTYAYTDFVQAEEQGVKDVVGKAGGSVQVFNANFDAQKLNTSCQDAVRSGRYNAILLGSVDSPTGVPCVTAAKAANIPVVTIEPPVGKNVDTTEIQVDGVVGAVTLASTPNADNLVEVAKLACEGLDPCEIIAEVATPSDHFTNEAVKRVAADVPGAKIVQKVAGQYDPSIIAKVFPDALSAHPETDVFLAAADSQALAVVPALKKAGKFGKVRLTGNGGSRLGAKAVADGTMFATAGNWPREMGNLAAEMLTKAINGEKIENPAIDAITMDEPRIVTKETVSQFKPEWGAEAKG
ncbi:MAG TPA: sugar ABC transporter substrate-binding protein [Solirubrobacteraceae bacterium]|nr:sugar ABC transporter substrate-binding protein [Solirubrobacteraceae bacterium]